jgi:metallo-beta-lactamase class B
MPTGQVMSGKTVLLTLAALTLTSATPPRFAPAAPPVTALLDACEGKEGWADPAPPAHLYGNTWYVGTCGITVLLVETRAGLVLLDAGPKEAAPQVLANVRALGFDPQRIAWILPSHEHFDHGGGIATIRRETGAKLAVGPYAWYAFYWGKSYPDDPQFADLQAHPMDPAPADRRLGHGGHLTLGGVTFAAHATPTHSPGSTSWTWRSCEGARCLDVAFADSVSTISSSGYRFTDQPARVRNARAGLATVAALPCDLLLTPHPSASQLFERLAGDAPLADPAQCRRYAALGVTRLDERLAKERAAK